MTRRRSIIAYRSGVFLALAQASLGVRVALRFWRARTSRTRRVADVPPGGSRSAPATTTVIVPVLNERLRLASCLDGLIAQGPEVREILVVDGGSCDGTPSLIESYAARHTRVRLIDAAPVPADWNGKAWGLYRGLQESSPGVGWILMVDADVRPEAGLSSAVLTHAERTGDAAFSLAPRQVVRGWAQGCLHPALLSTLVYRFGPPGQSTRSACRVQANGQCFLARRDVLEKCGALPVARASRCEDVTIARRLVSAGYAVGFYEAGDLVSASMYDSAAEAWRNWTRSLPMRDGLCAREALVGLCEVVLVQALPASLCLLTLRGAAVRHRVSPLLLVVNVLLLAQRLGVLVGMRRAYKQVPWTYWLSPLCDVPVALKLLRSYFKRHHVWRGRALIDGG